MHNVSMTNSQHILTSAERREIVRNEIRKALANIPRSDDKLRMYQVNAAKGIGRKRAMEIITELGG